MHANDNNIGKSPFGIKVGAEEDLHGVQDLGEREHKKLQPAPKPADPTDLGTP